LARNVGIAAILRQVVVVGLLLVAAGDASAQRMLVRDLLPHELPVLSAIESAPSVPGSFTAADLFDSPFLAAQLRHERVLTARIETRYATKQLFEDRGIAYPAAEMFVRVFKRERTLEVWVRPPDGDTFALLKTYAICALAGEPGPKRRQGDNQTPEGFYHINRFNPTSNFYLSLHIDYPNRSDQILGHRSALGGDIFIHGGCLAAGCIAVTDDSIKEIYWLAVEARAAGQTRIPVHIFPFRLVPTDIDIAARVFADAPELIRFWRSLEPGFRYFEETRRLPAVRILGNGLYALADDAEQDGGARVLGRPVMQQPD
jgi:murein L,D-transpeptidase YafK